MDLPTKGCSKIYRNNTFTSLAGLPKQDRIFWCSHIGYLYVLASMTEKNGFRRSEKEVTTRRLNMILNSWLSQVVPFLLSHDLPNLATGGYFLTDANWKCPINARHCKQPLIA